MIPSPTDSIIEGNLDEQSLVKLKSISNQVFLSKEGPANIMLAGNIQHEYSLPDAGVKIITPILKSKLKKHTGHFKWSISAWINYQKKYEFNPLHNHSGDFSFVIWIDIPYNIEDEMNLPWCMNSNMPCPSVFSLVYLTPLGKITGKPFYLDKKDSGRMVIFPSEMYHMVYPFYTSDDYRISIAGNMNAI